MEHSKRNFGTVAVTGATGYLGSEIVARLLQRDSRRILCFVRAATTDIARTRGSEAVAAALGRRLAPGELRRLFWVPGNIETDYLGLAPTIHAALAEDVEEIYHCAASTRLNRPLREARITNVRGVRNVYAFAAEAAANGGFRRFHHVSSAYVVGRAKGRVRAEALAAESGRVKYRNTYEQTKAEAERWLWSRSCVPLTVYRPTIIVGDSRDGRTTSRTAVHYVMNLMASQWLRFTPGTLKSRLDCVPGDFVADAILALGAREDSARQVYQIASGAQSLSVHELVAFTREGLDRYSAGSSRWHTEVLAPLPWWLVASVRRLFLHGRRGRALQRYAQCSAYTRLDCLFDNERECGLLAEAGIRLPVPSTYFPRIVDYAVRHDFVRDGRRSFRRGAAAFALSANALA